MGWCDSTFVKKVMWCAVVIRQSLCEGSVTYCVWSHWSVLLEVPGVPQTYGNNNNNNIWMLNGTQKPNFLTYDHSVYNNSMGTCSSAL